jgi:hypothetical protein
VSLTERASQLCSPYPIILLTELQCVLYKEIRDESHTWDFSGLQHSAWTLSSTKTLKKLKHLYCWARTTLQGFTGIMHIRDDCMRQMFSLAICNIIKLSYTSIYLMIAWDGCSAWPFVPSSLCTILSSLTPSLYILADGKPPQHKVSLRQPRALCNVAVYDPSTSIGHEYASAIT